ncbi:MAG: sugar phosphorylase [Pseudomonadota bacterium]
MTQSPPSELASRLRSLLERIYPGEDMDALMAGVFEAFWPEGTAPSPEARIPRGEIWSEKDAVLITYGNTILDGVHKPLDLLHDFLLEQLSGAVNSVHILPFFPHTSDDGFAVTDFTAVDPTLGDWPDIERIGSDHHLMSDLVLNHVSSQGVWFNSYRQGQTPYDKFFFEACPEDDLSMVVRPRTTPLLREVDTANGPRHVWCTFSHDQIDLNFANPRVLLEILKIIRLHIDKGIRILRLDAVAFIWKEVGTPSIHMPQTHAIIQLIRLICDYDEVPVVLITETNVPKAENLSYFGQSNEAHAIYNFPLPPLILQALLSGSAQYLRAWQAAMPPAPKGCAYFNFTASHDGIGMRPVEGLLPKDEIDRMIETVSGNGGLLSMRTAPDGTEAVYEINCSYFAALASTHAGDEDLHLERFLASQTIVMSLEGLPGIYIHSILATPNDYEAVERRGMNRAINRHRWNYPALQERLADPSSDQARVLGALTERLRLRAAQSAFHPNSTQFTLSLEPRLFGVWRQSMDRSQSIFAVHNVSSEVVDLLPEQLNLIADEPWYDLLSGEIIEPVAESIPFAPYQCRWITNRF